MFQDLARRAVFAGTLSVLHLPILSVLSGPASAAGSDEGGFVYGPVRIMPSLRAEAAYDDNLYFSPDQTVDSWVTRVAPRVDGEIDLSDAKYTLGYAGDYGRYLESRDDDYTDHEFSAGANLDLAHRHLLVLRSSYALQHQSRGSGLTQGFDPETGDIEGFDPDDQPVDSPDRLSVGKLSGSYQFGAHNSGNRLKLAAGLRDTTFRNHRDRTRYRDYDNYQAGATFYHQVLPATSLLLEVRGNEIRYAEDYAGEASLDSSEIRYLAGATWEITGSTSGTVKVGQVQKDFADDSRKDFSGLHWEVGASWSPRSYSQFYLSTSREERESYGEGDFIDTTTYSVTWNHGWTDLLQTDLRLSYMDETYQGVDRDQGTLDYGISVIYQWRRWLALELGADFSNSDSNVDWLVYDRNVVRFGATLAL